MREASVQKLDGDLWMDRHPAPVEQVGQVQEPVVDEVRDKRSCVVVVGAAGARDTRAVRVEDEATVVETESREKPFRISCH